MWNFLFLDEFSKKMTPITARWCSFEFSQRIGSLEIFILAKPIQDNRNAVAKTVAERKFFTTLVCSS